VIKQLKDNGYTDHDFLPLIQYFKKKVTTFLPFNLGHCVDIKGQYVRKLSGLEEEERLVSLGDVKLKFELLPVEAFVDLNYSKYEEKAEIINNEMHLIELEQEKTNLALRASYSQISCEIGWNRFKNENKEKFSTSKKQISWRKRLVIKISFRPKNFEKKIKNKAEADKFLQKNGYFVVNEVEIGGSRFCVTVDTTETNTHDKSKQNAITGGVKGGPILSVSGGFSKSNENKDENKENTGSSSYYVFGGVVEDNEWIKSLESYNYLQVQNENYIKISDLISDKESKKIVEHLIQERITLCKNDINPRILKDIQTTTKVLLIGDIGSGKSSIVNLFYTSLEENNNLKWFDIAGTGQKDENDSFTTTIRSHRLAPNIRFIDFCGWSFFDDYSYYSKFVKHVSQGKFKINKLYKPNKKYKSNLIKCKPDIIFLVVDMAKAKDKENYETLLHELFEEVHKNLDTAQRLYVIFNKIDTLLKLEEVNLTEEKLKDTFFDLQNYSLECGDQEKTKRINNMFNVWKSSSLKIWCHNEDWDATDESLGLMLREARSFLYRVIISDSQKT